MLWSEATLAGKEVLEVEDEVVVAPDSVVATWNMRICTI